MKGEERKPLVPPQTGPAEEPEDEEKAELDAIARRYGPALRGYFANRVRNPSDIDDLVQEVFLQLLRRGSDEPVEHVEQYLFEVSSNVLSD